MVQRLRMAGYRGQGPIVTFLAMRLIVPVVLFVVTAFYVFVVLQLDYPLFMKLTIVVAAALLGFYGPAIYVRNRITRRQKAIRRAWPDALDVLLICVESGMGVESALRKVSEEIGPQSAELAEELALTTAELSYLSDRRTAYQNLAARTGARLRQGRGDVSGASREIRNLGRPVPAGLLAGATGHAHQHCREKGDVAAPQAHDSHDCIFHAGSVRDPDRPGGPFR